MKTNQKRGVIRHGFQGSIPESPRGRSSRLFLLAGNFACLHCRCSVLWRSRRVHGGQDSVAGRDGGEGAESVRVICLFTFAATSLAGCYYNADLNNLSRVKCSPVSPCRKVHLFFHSSVLQARLRSFCVNCLILDATTSSANSCVHAEALRSIPCKIASTTLDSRRLRAEILKNICKK